MAAQKLELVPDLGDRVQEEAVGLGLGLGLGLQLTSFTGAPEMPATSAIASMPRFGTLVPQRVVTVTEPQGSRILVSTSMSRDEEDEGKVERMRLHRR
jgi:hypothetical protein